MVLYESERIVTAESCPTPWPVHRRNLDFQENGILCISRPCTVLNCFICAVLPVTGLCGEDFCIGLMRAGLFKHRHFVKTCGVM